jgi:histidinol-phosphate aminotransferase
MAGLRMGYGIASIKSAKKIKLFASGFNLNAAGIAAASVPLMTVSFIKKY